MSQLTYDELRQHVGHRAIVTAIGDLAEPTAISIECTKCAKTGAVLYSIERPSEPPEFAERETRPIEMYVGTHDNLWANRDVKIPLETPEDAIESVAKSVLERELKKDKIEAAFYGVYFIPDLEDLGDYEE